MTETLPHEEEDPFSLSAKRSEKGGLRQGIILAQPSPWSLREREGGEEKKKKVVITGSLAPKAD